jgi:NAD(P)-dependent dehydrogenase (short-subunit alcohol dehydrogenase family)
MKKTIFITGASSGFGRETAKLFQQQGWNVVATMRSPEKEQELNLLPDVLVTQLDVKDTASISAAIAAGLARFGSIDVLLNNAGYGMMGVFESSTPEELQQVFAVNVFGLMNVTRAILPHMRAAGHGVIINVSSFAGQIGMPFGSPYISSKFAVEGFSESLYHEVAPFNIAVKIIEPGSVPTNFASSRQMITNKIPAYDAFFTALFSSFHRITGHLERASALDVAQTIYNAATDGKHTLRYVIGADGQFLIDQRLQQNTDQDYINAMRGFFNN